MALYCAGFAGYVRALLPLATPDWSVKAIGIGLIVAVVIVNTAASGEYESRLELSRLILADFDQVQRLASQPFQLIARVGDVALRRVPDYMLVTDNGPLIVDVNPAASGGSRNRRQAPTDQTGD